MQSLARTQVRFPCELMDWLKKQAKDQGRSMNAQLVEIIKQAKGEVMNEQK
ncbi:Arc-like DNA binding domain-containing protein [Pseudomonas saponiphila]|uniref:Arc-like DNA binding domain-containing protein n=1 Tax=Pseudomonas saponiphila TaxID=556534 RepID=A0A1H4QYU9_9PSED|nr:Arc family DNA-binding protein [Pseudomonas saponiphila]SEC24830.1 Arc-like DNA binding domain-containing protein [Pseudomonas saponiphila]